MDETRRISNPTKGIWKRFLVLIPLAVVLGVISFFYIRAQADHFTAYGHIPYTEAEIQSGEVTFTEPGVVEVVSVRQTFYGAALVEFRAVADGKTEASFTVGSSSDVWILEVRKGYILSGGIDFDGWEILAASACVCLAVAVVFFADIFKRLWRASWYGYTMVAAGGGLLICLFQLLLNLAFLIVWREPSFSFFVYDLTHMASYFAAVSIPFMGVLALLVSLSNIALIRHEGLRPINLLGVATSVVWGAVVFCWLFGSTLFYRYVRVSRLFSVLDTAMAVGIAYGVCLLLSTMVCAWLASRHVPSHGMDYLVVLGCGIRADGTPCPLLAGRVDRAVDFDAARVAAGDAPATFVPSGGQGPDEPISEAESMGTYLETQRGIARNRIVLEDRSATTRENMAFSRQVIEQHAGRDANELRVGFSTTNYHVFRGYVSAHLAGMAVEGMGSKTKHYFWPNAFLREFVGLLVHQWKSVALVYVTITSLYLLANYIVNIM